MHRYPPLYITQFLSVKLQIFPYPLVLSYVLGAQKNRLNETVLLGTNNKCFGREIKKMFWYACPKFLLHLPQEIGNTVQ